MLKAGDRIGEWVVERALGEGGMGAVYRVHSALSQRVVAALKVMKPTAEPDARARFVREAEALSALRHPAIVHVMGFSEDPVRQVPYLAMELAVGETLKARMERGPLDPSEVVTTFAILAAALEHAHQAGVYHRDIKPANIILCRDGSVRLVDFGIAASAVAENLTTSGHLGTLAYMPPEVFRGEAPEPASGDVYAFGLLLHEALTGTRTFSVDPGLPIAAAAAAVGVRKLQQGPLDPGQGFPDPLRGLVRQATDPTPTARPTMWKMREVLDSLRDRRSPGVTARAARAVTDTAAVSRAPEPTGPILPPPVDRTTRVPDPPARAARRPPPQRRHGGTILLWGVMGMLGGGVLLFALARARENDRPRRPEHESSRAEDPRTTPRLITWPSTRPRPTPSPSVSPEALLPSPSPVPTPTTMPSVPAPETQATPPPEAGRPPPAVSDVRPSPPPEANEPAAAPEEEEPEAAPALGGRWEVVNEIESTSHPAFQRLRLGYRLRLRQEGSHITGEGQKVAENGVTLPPPQRTSITVSGTVEGSTVVLHFTEHGAERTSGGTFRWRLSPDGESMDGSFVSDAASSRGSSTASRVN